MLTFLFKLLKKLICALLSVFGVDCDIDEGPLPPATRFIITSDPPQLRDQGENA